MPTIKTRHNGDMVFETEVGRHSILNDVMPTPEWGGKNRHPTPPDYFVASISSCIAAFVVQYCNRAGLDTTGMTIELSFEKGEKPAHLKDFNANIHLPNAEVGDRMAALKRAAESCTIHETIARMTDGIAIEVTDKTAG
ncbi:putative redox protein, regulator of disulfide bond formation [Thioflavicoccus mobilis 8321]|uniref:Putative redox protein, regulator of disulfide bond formation n=1 Tax=Thioflavicoccus mobilis 8321 TaxID=765912 RepID=L0GV60_9GAMM|nr:OsmC family protein [Thioflavicoccus mobilis]AGA89876.1 putative redox protein, regulator of disulfide bond formation [Thioflavicoccus mobilis 8321]